MEQNSRISHVLGSVCPSAPFVFHAEVIVSVGINGCQISHAATKNVDHSIMDAVLGIGVSFPGILKPSCETGQVLSIEGSNDLVTGRDGNDFGMGIR